MSIFKISEFIIFTLLKSVKVSSKTGIKRLSNSTDTTLFAIEASSYVRTPIPGPISTTASFFEIPQCLTILWQISGFIKKFCPRDLEKLNP